MANAFRRAQAKACIARVDILNKRFGPVEKKYFTTKPQGQDVE